jgi:hypothetical protein
MGIPLSDSQRTGAALEAAVQQVAANIEGAFEGDAHAFLQAVYQDPKLPLEIRIMAAGRALRVEKPTLSASQSVTDVNVNIAARLDAARRRVARIGTTRLGGANGGRSVCLRGGPQGLCLRRCFGMPTEFHVNGGFVFGQSRGRFPRPECPHRARG